MDIPLDNEMHLQRSCIFHVKTRIDAGNSF